MIKIEIRRFLERLEKEAGLRFSLAELSRRTGIHRNVITRMHTVPTARCSTHDLDRLLMLGFKSLRVSEDPLIQETNPNNSLSDRQLLESLVQTLLSVLPDKQMEHFWAPIKPYVSVMKGDVRISVSTNVDQLWNIYERSENAQKPWTMPDVIADDDGSENASLTPKGAVVKNSRAKAVAKSNDKNLQERERLEADNSTPSPTPRKTKRKSAKKGEDPSSR